MSIQHGYEYKAEQIGEYATSSSESKQTMQLPPSWECSKRAWKLSYDLTVGGDWEVRERLIWKGGGSGERNTQ
jgi:hypothetical protein